MLHGLQCFPEIRVTCCLLSKSVWQASAFSCQSKLQTSTHHSVIGADEKKTVTSILIWAFRNSSAAPSIPTPSAWHSLNNTNRCDFQMQNEGKSVVCSHLQPFSQWYKKMRESAVMNNKIWIYFYLHQKLRQAVEGWKVWHPLRALHSHLPNTIMAFSLLASVQLPWNKWWFSALLNCTLMVAVEGKRYSLSFL